MLACKDGDDIAFQELMRRYIAPIFNFADQYVRNKEDAEDIAQEAFFKTWRYAKRFKSDKKFKPWLFTTLFGLRRQGNWRHFRGDYR